ncbi:hypothetical protein LRR18_16150 [Mangrovimonas sp. AS39]|uniref:hypothetical protein n=1 Tax=Mangrovimonas futianensis TaxID=2895523 RepID=UPI001E5B0685|nr:hypothetical protein [Mangrovimonas futianensis]MCF1193121.1 hypothetical protein [Mangrovimonas futianensis]
MKVVKTDQKQIMIIDNVKIGCISFFNIIANVFVYGLLRGLARNLANKNRIENPRGFS